MEILELQKRINRTLEIVNNAKSPSEKRRYFVILSGLVSIYNEITGSELQLGKTTQEKIMKYSFYEALLKEFNDNYANIYKISSGILQARKKEKCDFSLMYDFKTYSPKYMLEIFETFMASLGQKYYKIYKEAFKEGRVYFSKTYGEGFSIFDYEDLKSYIFVPKNKETLAFLSTIAHEFGHVFEFDETKFARKPYFTNKFNVNLEVFSMLIELLLFDYLRKINFNLNEVNKMEEKFYNDVIGYAAEIKFALSLSKIFIDYDCNLAIYDYDEADSVADKLEESDGIRYYTYNINLEDSMNYMYGGIIATIYRYYYNQDEAFISEIKKHFLDYEFYGTEEILDRLPLVREELNGFPILKKRLKQIKTNQLS